MGLHFAAVGLMALLPSVALEQPATITDTVCVYRKESTDEYLWRLYKRTPKVDRNPFLGKDQDFAWKDVAAAIRAGKSLREYAIDGVHPRTQRPTARLMYALEVAGFEPGITSGYRDDWYRQVLATGKKAKPGRSFHGGSGTERGYGKGAAFDIVSLGPNRKAQLERNVQMWRWIDQYGKGYGIGRPYGSKDPPHIGLIKGPEYIAKHSKPQKTKLAAKKKGGKKVLVAKAKGKTLVAKAHKKKGHKKVRVASR
jgi:hypothetical protein